MPWDEITVVSVCAYDLGFTIERCLTFDHVSGEFFETWERTDEYASAIAELGHHLDLVVDDPLTVCREVGPEHGIVELARRRAS